MIATDKRKPCSEIFASLMGRLSPPSVSICIVDDEGTTQFEAKVPSEVEAID